MLEDANQDPEPMIRPKPNRWPKLAAIIFSVLLVIALGSIFVIRQTYLDEIKPVSASTESQLVTITPGSSVNEIAELLEQKRLIKSAWAFEWHVRSREVRDQLQAGTYRLSPSLGIPAIVELFVQGKIDTTTVTILPGSRLDQVREAFIKSGFSPSDVDQALIAAQYNSHPALADKPAEASLEGYLYPETFQKDTNTKPADIVRLSLDEMDKRLTPELKQAFVTQGLTSHQAIILASIVEQEVTKPEDRAQAAQVFLKRFRSDMALGSDVTAFYGARLAGHEPSISFDSTYNTRIHKGLPPGPISNVSASSLEAVAHPANTDWLYFVAGDDKITYFSRTLQEHEALIREHCKKLCSEP